MAATPTAAPGEAICPPPSAVELELVRAQPCSRLVRAAAFGDVAVIQSMVTAGVDEHGVSLLQAICHNGERVVDEALFFAARCCRTQAVELLLPSGADMHAVDDSALRLASKYGHAKVVQLLIIHHGAHLHAGDDAPLQLAAQEGHADVVRLLIQQGASVHASHDAALWSASQAGHPDVVQLLIQHGADVHADFNRA